VETQKARQTVQFFSASMKRSFVGSLIFALKHKNKKSGKIVIFLTTASTKRAF
jgi:hypothetical protein